MRVGTEAILQKSCCFCYSLYAGFGDEDGILPGREDKELSSS